jgi:hypothetical protein
MENREETDRLCCICEKRSAGRIVIGGSSSLAGLGSGRFIWIGAAIAAWT